MDGFNYQLGGGGAKSFTMRVILVEPNLIGYGGHVIEFSSSLFTYGRKHGLEINIITNRKIDSIIKKRFGLLVLPLITNTCFTALENEGAIFFDDLK